MRIPAGLTFVLVIVAMLTGLAIGIYGETPAHPHCPTEDSCTVDYRDGAWHIEPTTP